MTTSESASPQTMPAERQGSSPAGEFDVTVRSEADEMVLALSGELDLDTAPALRSALAGVLDDESTTGLILDMSELEFIDSTGLRILVEAVSRLGDRGGELVVRKARPPTLRVLEICGLTQSIRIADS